MQKNVAGQKWIVFAFGDESHGSPGEPVTGDAANITANLYLDGSGTPNAVDDTNPTELGGGYYVFDITAAESNAENIVIVPASATANVNVIGVPGAVYTTPANFPDFSVAATTGRVDVASIEGSDATDQINAACDTAIETYGLDHLVSASVTGTDVADNSIIAQMVSDTSGTADWDDFDNTLHSLEAIRTRGDAGWTTGGGGSIAEILQWHLLVPPAIDLANTKAYRIAIALSNQLSDLPTGAEITPGTISIDRTAQGGTSWTNVVSNAAMTDTVDGLIYYDEVFDSASGYASGDMLRFTFKGQKITVSATDYEIAEGTTGIYAYSGIVADTPDVNIAQINGDATAAATLELFVEALAQGTGQIDSGTFASGAITATSIADGALTAAKLASSAITAAKIATDAISADKIAADAVTEIQSGLATAAALATVDTNVDAILVDTGTTLPGILGTPAGADMSADIAAVQTTADAVETDTQNIQSRLPTTLNNGSISADVQRINDVAVVGDGSGTPFTV